MGGLGFGIHSLGSRVWPVFQLQLADGSGVWRIIIIMPIPTLVSLICTCVHGTGFRLQLAGHNCMHVAGCMELWFPLCISVKAHCVPSLRGPPPGEPCAPDLSVWQTPGLLVTAACKHLYPKP